MTDQHFAAFSNPHEGDFVGSSGRFARRLFAAVLHLMSTADGKLKRLGEELREAIAANSLPLDYWRSEVGLARLLLQREPTPVNSVTAEVTALAYLMGIVPQIDIDTDLERPITIAGQTVHASRVYIKGSNGELNILDSDGAVLACLQQHVANGAAPVWLPKDESNLVPFGTASASSIVEGKGIDVSVGESSEDHVSSVPREFYDKIRVASGLLESFSPHYYVWTARAAKEIAVLKDSQVYLGAPASRSYLFCPTQIQVSVNATPLQLLNSMVHECSHQYFHLAYLNDVLISKEAPEVYSVLKKRNRPLHMVLLGYHAFGNVLLALSELLQNGLRSGVEEVEEQIAVLRPVQQGLGDAIEENVDQHFKPAGRGIYVPLRDLLVQRELLAINSKHAMAQGG